MGSLITILPSVLYIQEFAKNLIFVSKMSDTTIIFFNKKNIYTMVQGEIVLLRGVHIGTMHKLLGALLVMVATILLFLRVEKKKKKKLLNLWTKYCDVASKTYILERTTFDFDLW